MYMCTEISSEKSQIFIPFGANLPLVGGKPDIVCMYLSDVTSPWHKPYGCHWEAPRPDLQGQARLKPPKTWAAVSANMWSSLTALIRWISEDWDESTKVFSLKIIAF